MARRKTPRSVAYKLHLRSALGAMDRARQCFYCHRIKERLGFEWTPEEKEALFEAARHVEAAEKVVKDIFASRIGNQAVLEASAGDNA